MTESMNVTTQFVSDTQIFFRQNLDRLVEELETFDESTSALLDENLKKSKEIEERRIQDAIEKAMKHRAEQAGGGAPTPAP
jgi:DNA integrity scanning protein DisA with diadenylate cyclase activity